MHQIIKIPALKPDGTDPPFEVVYWDTGSTDYYVWIDHVEMMGFPSRKKTMRVCTVVGDVKTINGFLYQCQIVDRGGGGNGSRGTMACYNRTLPGTPGLVTSVV